VVNGVGIAEVNLDLGFGLFPNPAANEVFINAANAGSNKAKLRMLTIEGKEIYNQSFNFTTQTTQAISLQGFDSGIYFVEITNENGQRSVKKLVIEK